VVVERWILWVSRTKLADLTAKSLKAARKAFDDVPISFGWVDRGFLAVHQFRVAVGASILGELTAELIDLILKFGDSLSAREFFKLCMGMRIVEVAADEPKDLD